jgi:endo-1,4-beta-xylanase
MKRGFYVFLLIWACSARANLIFFGGINDPNLPPFPDPLMWGPGSYGIYNCVNSNYSDLQYAMQTDINSFNWTSYDAMSNLAHTRGLIRMWYGGYVAPTNQWLGNFPNWTGAQIVQATTNFIAAAAARDSSIQYINYCNEGVLDPTGYGGRFQAAFGGAGATGYDWVINLGKLFRQYFPNAKLGFNDFGIETAGASDPRGFAVRNPQFVAATKALVAAGVLDWVGFEGYDLQRISNTDLLNALNNIGACGVHVILSEFSPDGYQSYNAANQLADWQNLFPLYYTSPYVWGIVGPWGWRSSWNWIQGGAWFIDDSVSPPQANGIIPYIQSVLSQAVEGNPSPTPTPTPTPSPAVGVINNVQNAANANGTGNSETLTFPSPVTAGDALVIFVGTTNPFAKITSISDALGNVFALAFQEPGGNGDFAYCTLASAMTGQDSVSVTVDDSGGFIELVGYEFSHGSGYSFSLDRTTGATGYATLARAGTSANTTTPNEFVAAYLQTNRPVTAVESGWSSVITPAENVGMYQILQQLAAPMATAKQLSAASYTGVIVTVGATPTPASPATSSPSPAVTEAVAFAQEGYATP